MSSSGDLVDASAPVGETSAVVPPPPSKFKYKEANPVPKGVSDEEWNKLFSAADSRIYNRSNRKHNRSAAARESGQTRVLALEMLEEKRAKEAAVVDSSTAAAPADVVAEGSTVAEPTFELASLADPTSVADAASSTASQAATAPASTAKAKKQKKQNSTKVTSESTTPREGTPGSFSQQPLGIADTVKSESRSVTQTSPASREATPSGHTSSAMGIANKVKGESRALKQSSPAASSDNGTPGPTSNNKKKTAPKTKPSQTKKGTAIKKPAGKAKAGGKQKAPPSSARLSPTSPVTSDDEDADTDDGGSYCICGGPDDHTHMIACDGGCNDWYHSKCVKIASNDVPLIDRFICPNCTTKDKTTNWKPMCRLAGCRNPARVHANPPSKYCSEAHKDEWAERLIKKMPDGPEPSRGGALTKGELKALLQQCKTVEEFHNLGKAPSLNMGSSSVAARKAKNGGKSDSKTITMSELKKKMGVSTLNPTKAEPQDEENKSDDEDAKFASQIDFDWESILNSEEKVRLDKIDTERIVANDNRNLYREKERLLGMIKERGQRYISEHKAEGVTEICGFDCRLGLSETEFFRWRYSEEGATAFESSILRAPEELGREPKEGEEGGLCVKKRCARHQQWAKNAIQDIRFEDAQLVIQLKKLDEEEDGVYARAEIRAAS